MPAFDRKKAREDLLKRTQEAQERTGGEVRTKYFKTDTEINFWKPAPTKDDSHMVDIIPFMVGDHVPKIEKQNLRKGEWAYVIELYAHSNVGPGKAQILCPAKNYGKPCPLCEEYEERLRNGEEWEEVRHLSPSRRCVYNVVVMDAGKQEKKGVQLWEVSRKYSEEVIKNLVRPPRGGGIINFTDPDEGLTLTFSVLDDTYKTIQGHRLVERNYSISDEIMNKVHCIDELLLLLSYDEIVNLYDGEEKEKKENEEKFPEKVKEESKENIRPKRQSESKCQFGGEWGADCDKLKECLKECEESTYESCGKEFDKRKSEKEEEERRAAEEAAAKESKTEESRQPRGLRRRG